MYRKTGNESCSDADNIGRCPDVTIGDTEDSLSSEDTHIVSVGHWSSGSSSLSIINNDDNINNARTMFIESATVHIPQAAYAERCYDFEWFGILVVMLFVLTIEFAGYVIATLFHMMIGYPSLSSLPTYLVPGFQGLFHWGAIKLGPNIVVVSLYVGLFSFLRRFHDPIENFLTRYSLIQRGTQRKCLRFLAYAYIMCVMTMAIWCSWRSTSSSTEACATLDRYAC